MTRLITGLKKLGDMLETFAEYCLKVLDEAEQERQAEFDRLTKE